MIKKICKFKRKNKNVRSACYGQKLISSSNRACRFSLVAVLARLVAFEKLNTKARSLFPIVILQPKSDAKSWNKRGLRLTPTRICIIDTYILILGRVVHC